MERDFFDKLADDVFKRSIELYEKDINTHDPLIITEQDLEKYIDHRLDILRAHQERYTTELIWRALHAFSTGK